MLSPRPLLSPATVQTLADLSEDEVAELCEEGLLFPVFNICGVSNASRKELRILSAGLTYYTTTQRPLPADPEQVCADLFPPDMLVTTVSLRRTLNCSQQLVSELLKTKALLLMPREVQRRGRGGCAKINRQSAIQFLQKRVIGL